MQPVTIQCPDDLLEVLKTSAESSGHTVQAEILKRLAKSAKIRVTVRPRGRPVGWRKNKS